MKTFFTLLTFLICFYTAKTQNYVTIPDANFVTWLQSNVPSAMVGNQMDTTNLAVTTRTNVSIDNLAISDITGIQYFDSLQDLYCVNNLLSSLPTLPKSLKLLTCAVNQLNSLPFLPDSLKYLNCNSNMLQNLPALPNTLTDLRCDNNQLISLPILSDSLYLLECSNNQLTMLPTIPNQLHLLICSNNQLINLPILPNSLEELLCFNNQLNNLPFIPNSLYRLDCSHNQLTSIPVLPDSMMYFRCSYNNINCFNKIPEVNDFFSIYSPPIFDIKNNPFTCLPNYIEAMDSVTLNYPLCVLGDTINNQNSCLTGNGITGIIFQDVNANCVKNINEIGIKNITMKLYDAFSNILKFTNSYNNGIYYFNNYTGAYHVVLDTLNKPFNIQCLNPGIDSLVTLTSSHTLEDSVDFAIVCKSGFDVGIQSIVTNGIVFPGQTHILNINGGDISHWYNLNCASGISGTVSFSVNGPVTYVGPAAGALTPVVTGNIYTYNIADFVTINNSTDFKLIFQTNTTAQAGDVICVNATVTPVSGDNNLVNNTYQFCYNVVNSFDPNIKEVYPVEAQNGFNDWLTYTIHFQNTGNAPAINIRIEDQLDTKLDPETFELINYSHYNVIDLTGNHLTVRFPNIQLADSTSNPQGSIGFAQYRIKPKAGWMTDTIKNLAEIHFDYNAPEVTNTAITYFMTTAGINDINYLNETIGVSPNPANEVLNITSRFNFEKVELSSITGQVLIQENANSNNLSLTTDNLTSGIYFVKVIYPNGLSTIKKVIKQ